jgi:Raf kinase inhibitor-like YbhB/YbcL family protein
MKLQSSDFENRQAIPMAFTCDGDGDRPELEISEVPESTKSLVLIVDDPDAPGGSFIHWLVWNIEPKNQIIKRNSVPDGIIIGCSQMGKSEYIAPCPPIGTHVYLFKLYALDILLPLDPALNKKTIRKMMEGHIIERTILRGFYERAHSENF